MVPDSTASTRTSGSSSLGDLLLEKIVAHAAFDGEVADEYDEQRDVQCLEEAPPEAVLADEEPWFPRVVEHLPHQAGVAGG